MTEALAVFQGAGKSYDVHGIVVRALQPVTSVVFSGDHIAVTGPSGSGKSTLLNLLAGLDRPTEGSVTWPRFDSNRLRPGSIATAFQMSSLIPALTALDNVALPLLIMGETRDISARATAALSRFGVEQLADRRPAEISGGQLQRVALARAIITKPRLILADEPTGQLDTSTAKETLKTLIRVANEFSAALVIATHDAMVAREMNIVWTMSYGRLSTRSAEEAA